MKTRIVTMALLSITLILVLSFITDKVTRAGNVQELTSTLPSGKYVYSPLGSAILENTPAIAFTPVSTDYLPLIATNPPPFYQWLSQQQNGMTGLLASQQDNSASTYNNALAVIVFTSKGDYTKAKKILDYFNSRAGEFFNNRCNSFGSSCSQIDPCGQNAPCGFFRIETLEPEFLSRMLIAGWVIMHGF